MWLSFLPPCLVFVIGMLTHRIWFALCIGIIIAGLIATHFEIVDAFVLIAHRFMDTMDIGKIVSLNGILQCDNFFILAFLVASGVIIEMVSYSGGAKALVQIAKNSIRDKRSAETSSLLLSHSLFIDDYLSSLTVGSVLRPLTDRFRIPRVKLAFLVNMMAASLAMICPISSWAAAITTFLSENGIGDKINDNTLIVTTPNFVYIHSLPFIFYSFAVIASLWFIVRMRISFSVMHTHEEVAVRTGNVFGFNAKSDPKSADDKVKTHESVIDFIVPIMSLLFFTFIFILYFGDSKLLGGSHTLLEAIQYAQIALVLFSASAVAVIVSFIYFQSVKRFSLREWPGIAFRGLHMMWPAIVILVFAWTLGSLLKNDVKTGEYLASMLGKSIPIIFIPCIFFWIASLTSLSIGSTWGTTAILFPISIPMVISMMNMNVPVDISQFPILFPVIGAILSGALCGSHGSLMSDTAVMSSISSCCNHVDHMNAQWRYVLPIFIGTSLGFLLAGVLVGQSYVVSLFVPLAASLFTSFAILKVMHIMYHPKAVTENKRI